jgi:hypothetical protein
MGSAASGERTSHRRAGEVATTLVAVTDTVLTELILKLIIPILLQLYKQFYFLP